MDVEGPVGVVCSVQDAPFHVTANVFGVPPTAVHEVALKQLMPPRLAPPDTAGSPATVVQADNRRVRPRSRSGRTWWAVAPRLAVSHRGAELRPGARHAVEVVVDGLRGGRRVRPGPDRPIPESVNGTVLDEPARIESPANMQNEGVVQDTAYT